MASINNPCHNLKIPAPAYLKLPRLPGKPKKDIDITGFLKVVMGDEDSSLMYRGIMVK
jgi:hypothetical protein